MESIATALERLAGVSWPLLVAAVTLHLLSLVLKARAWQEVLQLDFRPSRVRFGPVLAAFLCGNAANAVIPAKGGELVKALFAKRAVQSSYAALLSSLLVLLAVDALVGAGVIAAALAGGLLPGLGLLVDGQGAVGRFIIAHPVAAILAISASVALLLEAGRFCLRRLGRGRLTRGAQDLARGFGLLRNRSCLRFLPLQLSAWVVEFAVIWLFLAAFAVSGGWGRAFTVLAVVSLNRVLPVTGGALALQGLLIASLSGQVAAASVIGFFLSMRFLLAAVNIVLGFLATGLALKTANPRLLYAALHPRKMQPALQPAATQADAK